jgi:hypothetical protein
VLKISRSVVRLLALVAAGGLAFPLRGRAVVPVALVRPSGIIVAIDVVHRCVRRLLDAVVSKAASLRPANGAYPRWLSRFLLGRPQ